LTRLQCACHTSITIISGLSQVEKRWVNRKKKDLQKNSSPLSNEKCKTSCKVSKDCKKYNLTLEWQKSWSGKRAGIARELEWQESWCGKRAGIARELEWQESWSGKKAEVLKDLEWQESWCGKRAGVAKELK